MTYDVQKDITLAKCAVEHFDRVYNIDALLYSIRTHKNIAAL